MQEPPIIQNRIKFLGKASDQDLAIANATPTTLAQVSHTYNKVGYFTVKLCVVDEDGGQSCIRFQCGRPARNTVSKPASTAWVQRPGSP